MQLGTLGKTFQLKGGLRFYALGDAEAEAILSADNVFIEGVGASDVREAKELGQGIIVYLTAALSVEKAKTLVNRAVYAAPDALPEPEDDTIYIYIDALIEQPVFLDGEPFGEVLEVLDADMQDVLKIRAGTLEVMVPLQAPYVEITDDGVYLRDVPQGLLELNR